MMSLLLSKIEGDAMPSYKQWDKDEFIERYNELKSQKLLEKEIAVEMFISKNTLYNTKKCYGLPTITNSNKELVNENGLTKEWLAIAKENGLNSSMVNARIRELNWSVEDACTIKVVKNGKKIMRKGVRKNANKKHV